MPASTWGWRLHRASFPSNTTQNSRPRPHEKLATRPSKIRDSSPCLTFRAKREQHYPESPFRRAAPARFEAQHPLRRTPPVAKRTQSVKVIPILRGGEAPHAIPAVRSGISGGAVFLSRPLRLVPTDLHHTCCGQVRPGEPSEDLRHSLIHRTHCCQFGEVVEQLRGPRTECGRQSNHPCARSR